MSGTAVVTVPGTGTCPVATNLGEFLITPTSLWLEWTSASGIQANTIQLRQANTTTWTSYTININAIAYTGFNNLTAGTYEWRLFSTCPGGATAATASRLVDVQCTPPLSRYLLGTTTSSGALVGWVGNRDWDPTISYGVRYRAVGGTTWIESTDFVIATFGSYSIRSSITGLTGNTAYEWQVKSICSGSSTSYSSSLMFVTSSSCNAPSATSSK